jgi:hypothetical protein
LLGRPGPACAGIRRGDIRNVDVDDYDYDYDYDYVDVDVDG